MKIISLEVLFGILILSGCAHNEMGKYIQGQFQTEVNDSNFIKLNPPEPDDYNPKLDHFRNFRCSRWEKRCDWRCLDEEL